MSNLGQLEYLNLEDTGVTDTKPLENLSALKFLNLYETPAQDIRLKCPEKLISLGVPEGFRDLRKLKVFSSLKHVTMPRWVQQVDRLSQYLDPESITSMRIQNNGITHIKGVERFNELRVLDLFANAIEEITAIGDLQQLRKLNFIPGNRINSIKAIKKLKKLKCVHLYENPISSVEIQDMEMYFKGVEFI